MANDSGWAAAKAWVVDVSAPPSSPAKTAHFDEAFASDGSVRAHYAALIASLGALRPDEIGARVQAINATLLQRGVTFTVYADEQGTERIFPFDIIPRIITPAEWTRISNGIAQRVRALNAFLNDVYHDQRIVRDGIVPAELVWSCRYFVREMIGLNVPAGVYIHVSGIDLLRDGNGAFVVLEDNVRTPSGVSYVLENREVLTRTFPAIFSGYSVAPVDDYPRRLLRTLLHSAPHGSGAANVVVLTPGIHNSAYFEHALLARRMGVELVEGRDLIVLDDTVHVRTTRGLERVDVLYRRVDDEYLDPLYFKPDSGLGIAGLLDAYRAGNVTLANAPGTGVADDKAIYPFVPAMIKYYLSEEPLIDNVETFEMTDERHRRHVLAHLERYVVKTTFGSGGYGMLIGPAASAAELEHFRTVVEANPRDFIAQPVVALSTVPTLIDGALRSRHVDLRPFVLLGEEPDVSRAALTRVALREGSLVVNSSQGGGSKDTWVLTE
jgi:uncharacterized circularly permuted ATP-grasp superfamily protein